MCCLIIARKELVSCTCDPSTDFINVASNSISAYNTMKMMSTRLS